MRIKCFNNKCVFSIYYPRLMKNVFIYQLFANNYWSLNMI